MNSLDHHERDTARRVRHLPSASFESFDSEEDRLWEPLAQARIFGSRCVASNAPPELAFADEDTQADLGALRADLSFQRRRGTRTLIERS